MENVYVIVQGELYDSERIVCICKTLEGAQRRAAEHVESERLEEGISYDVEPGGTAWKAGGCYVRIRTYGVD